MADELEARITVRLKPADVDVLNWLTEYIRGEYGAGVSVERSDAIRWALHTCKRGLAHELEVGGKADLPGGLEG